MNGRLTPNEILAADALFEELLAEAAADPVGLTAIVADAADETAPEAPALA